jgi:hypothetical protein
METKQLLTIEFRYTNKDSDYISKTITIGVFNTFNEATIEGNKQLEILESRFKLHRFPNGLKANKKRFGLNNCFGFKRTNLVTNLAYLKTPFDFYFKITELTYISLNDSLAMVMNNLF